jgi:hypothetical protein
MVVTVARLLSASTTKLADEDSGIPEDIVQLVLHGINQPIDITITNKDRVFTVLKHWSVLQNLGLACILLDNNQIVCYEILAYLINHATDLNDARRSRDSAHTGHEPGHHHGDLHDYFDSEAFPVELHNWYMAWDKNIDNVRGFMDVSKPFRAMLSDAYSSEYVIVYQSLVVPMSHANSYYVTSTLLNALCTDDATAMAREHYVLATILLRDSGKAVIENIDRQNRTCDRQIRTWLRKVFILGQTNANHQRRWMVEVFKFCMADQINYCREHHRYLNECGCGLYRFSLKTIEDHQKQFIEMVEKFLTSNLDWKKDYPKAPLGWFKDILPVCPTAEFWMAEMTNQNKLLVKFYNSRPHWLMSTHDDFVIERYYDSTNSDTWFISKQYVTASEKSYRILQSLEVVPETLALAIRQRRTPPVPAFEKLNAKQRAVIKDCIDKPVSFITGGPGCGKTHTFVHLLNYYRDVPVLACAFTGKATENIEMHLQRNGIEKSDDLDIMTIHRAVFMKMFNPKKLCPEILVIDEASMVSLLVLSALLRTFKRSVKKVVFVGDACQLPPIDIGTPFLHMIHARQHELVILDQQERSNDIITKNTYRFRNVILHQLELTEVEPLDYWFEPSLGEVEIDICPDQYAKDAWEFIQQHDVIDQHDRRDFIQQHDANIKHVQVLCYTNKSCDAINKFVREQRLALEHVVRPSVNVPLSLKRGGLKRGGLERGGLERGGLERGGLEKSDWSFFINDRVVCTKNDYNVDLMNGSRATVKAYMQKATIMLNGYLLLELDRLNKEMKKRISAFDKDHTAQSELDRLFKEMKERISAFDRDCMVPSELDRLFKEIKKRFFAADDQSELDRLNKEMKERIFAFDKDHAAQSELDRLFKEMLERISASDDDDCVVQLEMDNGKTIFVSGSYLEDRFQLAYACTVHKSQGSEWSHVALYMPKVHQYVSNSLIYTAVTRAKNSVTIKAPTISNEIGTARRIINTGKKNKPPRFWCLFSELVHSS